MTVLTCHILMAVMKFLYIESLNQIPPDDVISDAESVWMQSNQERQDHRLDQLSDCGRVCLISVLQ